MSTTAQEILTLAFQDIGVLGEGETLSQATATQGLTRLNNMVSGWQAQYGTVIAIERTIFPLVADKQTYTIGLGGDFNVPRPTTIPGAGLLLAGLDSSVSVTITRVGSVATVAETSHPYSVGDEAYIDGAVQIAYNGLQTVQTVPNANSWTFTVEGTPTTPATGTITSAPLSGQPIEIPRAVITDDAYQGIRIKNLPNPLFTMVYYNPTAPLGTVFLWPSPNTAANQLVLYLQNVFTGFATLTTQYDYPSLPGYAEALEYNVAKRLRVAYPLANARPDIDEMAAKTLGLIKRANNKLTDVPTDAVIVSRDPRGGYNILTGTGG